MKVYRKAKIEDLIQFDKKHAGLIIGVDEAGRGPVAGPVTACALCFVKFSKDLNEALKYLDDSKRFSSNPILRKELSEEIKKFAKFSIFECSVEEIEKHNILQASLIAMRRACDDLIKKIDLKDPTTILVDGKFPIPNLKLKQKPIIKGDTLSASIAAASIMAKVHRDELMAELSEKYPEYNWKQNKGYPTPAHLNAIKEHGPCLIHRKTFLHKILTPQLKML